MWIIIFFLEEETNNLSFYLPGMGGFCGVF